MATGSIIFKNIVGCILTAAFVSAVSSCTREVPDGGAQPCGEIIKITALSPEAYSPAENEIQDSTKTYLEGTKSVYWKKGDKVSAFYDGGIETIENINENGQTGQFEFPYRSYTYAFYPGKSEDVEISGNKLTIRKGIPQVQYATAGSFDPRANLTVATASATWPSWQFYNAGALLAIRLSHVQSNVLQLSKIRVINDGSDSYMTGKVEVAINGESTKTSVVGGELDRFKDVVLQPQEGEYISIPHSAEDANTYYLVVAPGTYGGDNGGLKIELTNSNNKTCVYKTNKELTVNRNSNVLLADIAVDDVKFSEGTIVVTTTAPGDEAKIDNDGANFKSKLSGTVSGTYITTENVTCGFEYGFSSSGAYSKEVTSGTKSSVSGGVSFTADATGITDPFSTTIYYRAWASVDGGATKTYGAEQTISPVTVDMIATVSATAETTVDLAVTGGAVTLGGYKGTVTLSDVEFYEGSMVVTAGDKSATSVTSSGFNFTASSTKGSGFALPASGALHKYYVRVKIQLGTSYTKSLQNENEYATANSVHTGGNTQRYTNMRGEGGSGTGQNVWDFGTEMRYNIKGTTYAGPCSGTKDVYLYYDSASGSSSTDWKEVFHYTTYYYVGKSGLTGDSSAQTVWNARTSALTSHSIDIKNICYGLKISPDVETAGVMGFEITGYDTLTLGHN